MAQGLVTIRPLWLMSLNVSSIFSNLMSVLQRSSELETHHNIGYIGLYHNSFFTWLFGKKHFVLDNPLNYCYINTLIGNKYQGEYFCVFSA